MSSEKWQPIETAPKDGTRIQFRNEENDLTDAGYWEDWGEMEDWQRELLPEHAKDWTGEWCTDHGNGEMTHWAPIAPEAPNEQ